MEEVFTRPLSPPGIPRVVTAIAGNNEVVLGWKTGDDGGSPILSYQYGRSTDGGVTVERWNPISNTDLAVGATTTYYTVTGLTNGTAYFFAVRAVNRFGPGEGSFANGGSSITPMAAEPDPLTASFESMPETHDGSAFSFRMAFSELISTSYTVVRDHAFDVTGGAVTDAHRVDGRRLTNALSRTVRTSRTPFLAYFAQAPDEHVGDPFTLQLELGKNPPGLSYRMVRDHLLDVTGGAVTKAKRLTKGSNQSWTVTIAPDSNADVPDRGADGRLVRRGACGVHRRRSAPRRRPRHDGAGSRLALRRRGQGRGSRGRHPRLRGDAEPQAVRRYDGGVHDLHGSGRHRDGEDYTATTGTLTIARLKTTGTVSVPVIDDDHDEGSETLTLTLSSPSGALLGDGTATDTITNTDPLPRAMLARFGRTAAVHVVEHVEERIAAPREPGFRGRFAGRELRRGMERELALSFLNQLGGTAGRWCTAVPAARVGTVDSLALLAARSALSLNDVAGPSEVQDQVSRRELAGV